jgi:hypothetical protein
VVGATVPASTCTGARSSSCQSPHFVNLCFSGLLCGIQVADVSVYVQRSSGCCVPTFAAQHKKPTSLLQVARQVVASSAESTTERVFRELEDNNHRDAQAGGAGGSTTLEDLRRMDQTLKLMRSPLPAPDASPAPTVVSVSGAQLDAPPTWDVIICGGTLGVFIAAALQLKGLKVAVVERGALQGRSQEWNISRREVQSLVDVGILSEEDVEVVISMECNPVRVGFLVRSVAAGTMQALPMDLAAQLVDEHSSNRYRPLTISLSSSC